jgi:hypothetical protein
MPLSSKDIAKRLRFDHRPRRDRFRRLYAPTAIAACMAGVALWVGLGRTIGTRQYSPGPLTAAHATFGDRCEQCHVRFASAPDAKCLDCHAPGSHSEFQVDAPPCRDCHVEHTHGDARIRISDRPCVACHRALASSRQGEPAIAAHIARFADHPQPVALREGRADPTALRFNHELHLTSRDVREHLTCDRCHVVAPDGTSMAPITFAAHCQRCHEMKVKEAPVPIGEIEAPHDKPAAVRAGLSAALLLLGAQRPREIFTADQQVFIPGQPPRGPVDESKSLQEFQRKWTGRLEAELYRPFVDQPPLLENNKYCFLCHIPGTANDADGLPTIAPSTPPARWLLRSEFSHRKHAELPCATCHKDVEHSRDTADTNLPRMEVCQQCHVDARPQSAGTACVTCHRYHAHGDAAHPRPMLTLERLRPPP